MRRNILKTIVLCGCLSGALQLGAAASGNLGGTFNADGIGTRPLGLGGAFVAVADDANATWDNPAGMGLFDGQQRFATFTRTAMFGLESLSRDFVAYAQPDSAGYGAVGFSWQRFSMNFDPEVWAENTFAYSGAKRLAGDAEKYPKISAGWNVKYFTVDSGFSDAADGTSVGGGTASGYGLDLGLMIRLRRSLTLGVMARDLYSSLNWSSGTLEILPTTGRAGAAYKMTEKVLFAAEGRGKQTSTGFVVTSWHVGGEYWLSDGKKLYFNTMKNFGIRAGYFQNLLNSDNGQATVGASLKAEQWQIDYTFQMFLDKNGLGDTQRFGLSVLF